MAILAPSVGGEDDRGAKDWMPSPRAMAVAVLAMIGLGVLLGSATGKIAQSAGLSPILVEVAPTPPAEAGEAPEESAAPPAPAAGPAALPAESSSLPAAPIPTAEPTPEAPPALPPELPEEAGLPEVRHLFVIVLGELGFEEAFGPDSPAPYLAKTLAAKGEVLTNYYAVAGGGLANQIALLSGQGPTAETVANCPVYADLAPGAVTADGQAEGAGCVYPAGVETLPGQLTAAGLSWKAYVEDSDNGVAAGQPASCRHPAPGSPDPSQAPIPGDAYVTWRNPFVYFHSLVDDPSCAESDVDLERLAADLSGPKRTPTLSYLIPNACHAGAVAPCEDGQPSGPLAAEPFLRTVVPQILGSAAYEQGGMIAIVPSLAPQSGEAADASSCCVAPAYPNLPAPVTEADPQAGPVKASGGGGRVGLLLISPFVEAGSVNEGTYANHYALLLTIEELFGLEKLGYANEPALTAFDSAVFNAAAEPAQSSRINIAVSRPRAMPRRVRAKSGQLRGSRTSSWSIACSTSVRCRVP
jgi:hypothetical protein